MSPYNGVEQPKELAWFMAFAFRLFTFDDVEGGSGTAGGSLAWRMKDDFGALGRTVFELPPFLFLDSDLFLPYFLFLM
jgi:hypothetical protein